MADIINTILLIVGIILLIVGLFTTFLYWDVIKGVIEIIVGIVLIGIGQRSRLSL